jgi:hypothetical protein
VATPLPSSRSSLLPTPTSTTRLKRSPGAQTYDSSTSRLLNDTCKTWTCQLRRLSCSTLLIRRLPCCSPSPLHNVTFSCSRP